MKLKRGNVIPQTTRKLVIRVGRDLSPSSTVLRDKDRKTLEKDGTNSEDLAIKPAKNLKMYKYQLDAHNSFAEAAEQKAAF